MSVASTASIVDHCESPTTTFHRRCQCLVCQVKSVNERSTQQLAVKLLGGVDVRTDQHRCTCAGSKHEVASEEPVRRVGACRRTRSPSFEPYPLSSGRRTHKGALSGTTFGSRCHVIDRSSSFGSSGSFGTLDRALLSAVYCDDSRQRSPPPAGNERHGASSSLYAEPSDSSLRPPRSYPWLQASDTDNTRRHLYYRPKPLQRYVHVGDESLPWMFRDSSTSPLTAVPPAITSDEDMSAGNQRHNGRYSGPPVSVSDVVEDDTHAASIKPSSGSFEDLPTNGALIDLNRRSSKPWTSGTTVTSIVIDASSGDSARRRMQFAGIHEESGSMSYSIAEVLPVSTPSRSRASGMSYSYPSSGCEEVDQSSGDKSKSGPVDMGYRRVQFMPWNTTSRTYKTASVNPKRLPFSVASAGAFHEDRAVMMWQHTQIRVMSIFQRIRWYQRRWPEYQRCNRVSAREHHFETGLMLFGAFQDRLLSLNSDMVIRSYHEHYTPYTTTVSIGKQSLENFCASKPVVIL
ncbi:hypothetical protein EDD18DRAFT_1100456 [Armillaria luteobubalina]|uniref:Uncharacterized protein n=1 Tax=Armillaria luteobubalina TaxID=153913 RepID=A0AA39TVV4_9AGAR|nr:hypothetical protein EDD18DRAFT_1100456 [Armillaria luteobubalina]